MNTEDSMPKSKPSSGNTKSSKTDSLKLCRDQSENYRMIKIPVRIISEANTQSHWTVKRKRQKKINMLLGSELNRLGTVFLPCHVILTRIAPRAFDHDNLLYSLKNQRDVISDFLIPGLQMGRADNDERLSFEYRQEKGDPKEYALKIELISR